MSRRTRLTRAAGSLRRLARDLSGVSMVEFALLAPILIGGAIIPVDIGLAAYERMAMDHALRVGAQAVMDGEREVGALAVMNTTAAENFDVAGGESGTFQLAIDTACRCASSAPTAPDIACDTPCSDDSVRYRYLSLTASKSYRGILLPPMQLESRLRVQVE